MNCWVRPATTVGVAGVTAIETSVGPVTVRVAVPLTEPEVAVMVVEPMETPIAKPALEILATPGLELVQVTELVRSAVVESLYVPVAVNCCVTPTATEGVAGVTAIEISEAGVTVKVAVPETLPDVAVIVVDPTATAVALPPAAMVAVAVLLDVQEAELDRSLVDPSL